MTVQRHLIIKNLFYHAANLHGFLLQIYMTFYRRYMAEILPIRRKTLSNQYMTYMYKDVNITVYVGYLHSHCRHILSPLPFKAEKCRISGYLRVMFCQRILV